MEGAFYFADNRRSAADDSAPVLRSLSTCRVMRMNLAVSSRADALALRLYVRHIPR